MPVRLGVVGLGRGFMLMIPTFTADPRVKLVAAAAPRAESRAAFEAEFGGRTYDDIVPLIQGFDWLSDADKKAILEDNSRQVFKLDV